jgi:predicted GNAT family acetyltransferase
MFTEGDVTRQRFNLVRTKAVSLDVPPDIRHAVGQGGTMASEIAIRNEPDDYRIVAELDGCTASAWYERDGDTQRFVRIHVPAELESRGVVNQLIRVALVEARMKGLLVEPLCPEFLIYMRDHPETHDLLSAGGLRLLTA